MGRAKQLILYISLLLAEELVMANSARISADEQNETHQIVMLIMLSKKISQLRRKPSLTLTASKATCFQFEEASVAVLSEKSI